MSEPSSKPPADDARVDVVQYPAGAVKAVPAGTGADVVRSRNRERSGSVLTDRVVVAAAVLGILVGAPLVLLVLAYSLLIARTLLLGMVGALLVVVAGTVAVGMVAVLRRDAHGEAELLAADVTLRDAREQWIAEPVPAVARGSAAAGGEGEEAAAAGGDREGRRDRDHATEG